MNHYALKLGVENSDFGFFERSVDKGGHIYVGKGMPVKNYISQDLIVENNAHPICFGATGSAKSTAIIAPNILWKNSSFVAVDPKAELSKALGNTLEENGFKIVMLDPYGEGNREPSSYDPVALLNPSDRLLADKIYQQVDAMVERTGVSDSYWDSAARKLYVGTIAYVRENINEEASLIRATEILQSGTKAIIAMARETVKNMAGSLAFRNLARFAGLDPTDRELNGVLASLLVQLEFLDSEPIRASLKKGSFSFEELVDPTKKVAVFITLPPEKLKMNHKYQRLMVTQAISAISAIGGNPKSPVDIYIDEAGTIGRLETLSSAVGIMRARGLRVWTFYQTLSQLQRDFPNDWENFIGNSGTILLLNAMDNTTAEYFSKKIGKPIRTSFKDGRFFDNDFGVNPLSTVAAGPYDPDRKPIFSPEELCQLPSNLGIVLTDAPAALFVKAPYYNTHPFCNVLGLT